MKTWTGAVTIAVLALASGAQGAITLLDRSHLNVLNSDQVVITATVNNVDAAPMVTAREGAWQAGPGATIQVDLGVTRNIKRIRTLDGFSNYNYTGLTVETSDTGLAGSWTAGPGSFTNSGTDNQTFTLDTGAYARYVRMSPTGFQLAPDNRWIPTQMRIFGDTGGIDPSIHLDLLSSSAITGGATAALIGTVSYEDGTTTFANDFANDDPGNIKRKIIYNLGAGDGFQFGFTQNIAFGRMGGYFTPGHGDNDPANAIKISVGDGVTFTPVYKNYTGLDASPTVTTALTEGLTYFNFTPTLGTSIKFEFVASPNNSNWISDVMLFQIPEPATVSLLALAGLALLRRRP